MNSNNLCINVTAIVNNVYSGTVNVFEQIFQSTIFISGADPITEEVTPNTVFLLINDITSKLATCFM